MLKKLSKDWHDFHIPVLSSNHGFTFIFVEILQHLTSHEDQGHHYLTQGNQSICQYLSVHKDSFSNPPTNRRLEEAVVCDWPKMMKFKAL
ncbi:hypothetical protein AVEN_258162-1 [Araneus ventricosus]|uniref:Uncharacterized protein n=1 Tax=Araneus ventricosus TaxID=182803 RepID=A0A4Y2PM26_ARAVE|nr:hypothetical protein AVEN_261433-1 [Araneus ventricosus]GBN51975.1 hypothetical protein AVEN_28672-1 [Araneus ventricosus]GBN56815.1 hypothetical protein AVEN_155638-1 [Araneus ventricosus]GBN56820.1 hypothetical protein AVEN_258162-1 [Araneus ventricosus]